MLLLLLQVIKLAQHTLLFCAANVFDQGDCCQGPHHTCRQFCGEWYAAESAAVMLEQLPAFVYCSATTMLVLCCTSNSTNCHACWAHGTGTNLALGLSALLSLFHKGCTKINYYHGPMQVKKTMTILHQAANLEVASLSVKIAQTR